MKRRLVEEGAPGLLSKKRGKPSNRGTSPELLRTAVAIIREPYPDFGPTFAREKLDELHDIKLSV